MIIQTIRCAKCDKLVDLWEWRDDYDTGERVIRAKCHGATDEMRIDLSQLSLAQLYRLQQQEGVAFLHEQKALP